VPGQASLIDSDPGVQGRFFNGGYVLVAYKPGLHSEQFTIEGWVRVDVLAANFEHTLFDAGGNYGSPAGTPDVPRGFRIFADRTGHWQVRMGAGPGGGAADPFRRPRCLWEPAPTSLSVIPPPLAPRRRDPLR
jgi:hypothetical protein